MSYYGYGGYYDYGYSSAHTYQGPGAVSQLTGPSTSAYIGTAYHGSYAYETERGGIYKSDFTVYRNGYVSHTSYAFSGADTIYKDHSTYTRYTDKTPQSPYSRVSYYYSYYPSPYGDTVNSDQQFSAVYHYYGNNEYIDATTLNTTQTSEGYLFSTYIHSTFERTGGSFDSGSGSQYYAKSLYGPYGYVSSEAHLSYS